MPGYDEMVTLVAHPDILDLMAAAAPDIDPRPDGSPKIGPLLRVRHSGAITDFPFRLGLRSFARAALVHAVRTDQTWGEAANELGRVLILPKTPAAL